MPHRSDDAPEPRRAGAGREAHASDAAGLEEERQRVEAEELASFERRAEWWRLHYGGESDELIAERARQAPKGSEGDVEEPGEQDGLNLRGS